MITAINQRALQAVLLTTLLGLAPAHAASGAAAGGPGWGSFLGAFHVLVVHFPIGFVFMAGLLEAVFLRSTAPGGRRAVHWTLGAGVAAAWLTATLGLFRGATGEFDAGLLAWHRWLGLAVAALATVTWAAHGRWLRRGGPMAPHRALLASTIVCVAAAAHEGGSLTHGSRFLAQNAPPAVAGLLDRLASTQPQVAAAPGAEDAVAKAARTALETKCFSCHGPEKQKGKLRLDLRASALAGGSSGEPAITPGDVFKSRVARVILLPRSDDDAMPPDGKEPLTDQEAGAVLRWIQAGASYGAGTAAGPGHAPQPVSNGR